MTAPIGDVLGRYVAAADHFDRDLEQAFAASRGRIRTPQRTRDLSTALGLAHARVLNLAKDLDGTHAHALSLARNVQFAGFPARDFAGDLTFARVGAAPRDLAYDVARQLARHHQHTRELVLDDDLTLILARLRTRSLHNVIQSAAASVSAAVGANYAFSSDTPAQQPNRYVLKLIDTQTRVLPAAQRSRYREEFHNELGLLAEAGASRWTQTMYALRQLNLAFELRAELLRKPGKEPSP